mgnify:FL=1
MDDLITQYLEYEMWVEGEKTTPSPTDFYKVKDGLKVIKYSSKVRETGKATLFSVDDKAGLGFWSPVSVILMDDGKKIKLPEWFVIKLVQTKG